MALSMPIEFRGVPVSAAYIRVVEPAIGADKQSMRFGIQYCATPEHPPLQVREVAEAPYDLDGANPLQQAYEHLKTLPEFVGAVDVLEDGRSF